MAEPVCSLTVAEAIRAITGFDIIAIEQFTGRSFEELGTLGIYAATWVQECRRQGTKVPWSEIMHKPIGELEDYFTPESEDDTEGKAEPSTPLNGSPISASELDSLRVSSTS